MIRSEDNLPIKAVVTGANGWLGKGLLNAMINGVSGVSNLPTPLPGKIRALVLPGEDLTFLKSMPNLFEVIEGDITNPIDCHRLMVNAQDALLFHTAGLIHPKKVNDFYRVNLDGTKNILHAAERGGLKRAVIVSSNSPIGCNPFSGHLFNECAPFNPYMHYGRSKMLMEKLVTQVQEKGRIETVRIRAPWFYGPFQPERQTLFFQMVRDGKGPIIGSGANLRSMAFIDNLAQGLLLAAYSSNANGKVYWIADERPYSMNEIVDTIENVLEEDFGIACAHKRMRLPNIASEIAWCIDYGLQGMGFYNQKLHVLSELNKNIACSIELAKDELGYMPTTSLRDGMHKSISWIISNYGKI